MFQILHHHQLHSTYLRREADGTLAIGVDDAGDGCTDGETWELVVEQASKLRCNLLTEGQKGKTSLGLESTRQTTMWAVVDSSAWSTYWSVISCLLRDYAGRQYQSFGLVLCALCRLSCSVVVAGSTLAQIVGGPGSTPGRALSLTLAMILAWWEAG